MAGRLFSSPALELKEGSGRGTGCARAPRELVDAPGVAVVLGFPRSWPVRGEPELAGGGAKGERRREEDLARFRARVA